MTFRSRAACMALAATAILPWLSSGTRAEAPRVAAPITHGNVSVYLLRGASAKGPVPLTLDEALARNVIDVVETGNVRELKIENRGAEAVFVQMGDIVKGGRQDRVLTVSLLLEPKSGQIPIGAYCVEQGRWSPRGKEDAHRFARSETLLPSAAARMAIARPAASATIEPVVGASRAAPIEAELNAVGQRNAIARLQQRARPDNTIEQQVTEGPRRARQDNQGEVWKSVDVLQRSLSDNLATSVASDRSRTSLQLSLENEQLKAAQAAYVAALVPAGLVDGDANGEIIGVAIAIGGKLTSADLYPSNGLFRKMWPKIVTAAATEAIASTSKAAVAAATPPAPSIENVRDFLTAAEAGSRSEHSLGSQASLETRDAEKVFSVRATAAAGRLVHRSYLAK